MADFTETELDCDNFAFDIDDQFHRYQDRTETSRPKKRFRKSFKNWDIDKPRLLQLQKLSLMKLPQRTIHVLSKLIINHQITEIGKVVKIRRNCITIKAKVNMQSANYRNLLYEDIILKIFTSKNHTKPDVESAKVCSDPLRLDRDIYQPANRIHYYRNLMYLANIHDLIVMRIDSIVIVKSVRTTPGLEEVLRRQPYLRVAVLENLLESVRALRESDNLFWGQLTSMNNIFYRNYEWDIVYTKQGSSRSSENGQSLKNFTANVAALVNVFRRHGVPRDDLKYACYQAFRSESGDFKHVLSQLKIKFGWTWPSFVDISRI